MTGIIFNIQKFSLHDGPGIRTVVFFKGCPLSCRWCSNPESINARPELSYMPKSCLGVKKCGLCLKKCPKLALSPDSNGKILTKRADCTGCGECVDVCPTQARTLYGEEKTIDEILQIVTQDTSFYGENGGLTLSGGESLLQAAFASELLKKARTIGLTTSIETSLCVKWEAVEQAAKETDFIHLDLKHPDSKVHKANTGVANELIIENFRRLCQSMPNKNITVRTPVIPGVNDNEEAIAGIIAILRSVSKKVDYELLAFHQYGENKYDYLDRQYPMKNMTNLAEDKFAALKDFVQREYTNK